VLYGRTIPGGLVNQVSKRPQITPHREVLIGTSDFGGAQGSLYFIGLITEDGEWSYRLLGQARNMHTQIDHERDRQMMIAPAITWSPRQLSAVKFRGHLISSPYLLARDRRQSSFRLLARAEELDAETPLAADTAPISGERDAIEKVRLNGERIEARHVAGGVAAGEKKRFVFHARQNRKRRFRRPTTSMNRCRRIDSYG